jgi:hypothetical protein
MTCFFCWYRERILWISTDEGKIWIQDIEVDANGKAHMTDYEDVPRRGFLVGYMTDKGSVSTWQIEN